MSRAKLSPEAKDWRASEKRLRTQRERMAMQRDVSAARKAAGLTYHAGKRDTEAEVGWRLQMSCFPSDTRGLTARICGDPLYERSALYMKTRVS